MSLEPVFGDRVLVTVRVSSGTIWQPAEEWKCYCNLCAGHVILAGSGTMRGLQITVLWEYRNALHYVSLASFVASCTVILPGVFFLAAETSNHEYSTVVQIPKATELEWIFSLNEEENEIVRSEFYYEQVRSGERESNIISSLENYLNSHVCLSFLELSGSQLFLVYCHP